MKNLPDNVLRYLQKYSTAEAGKWDLECNSNLNIVNAVVIPAMAEYENLFRVLSSLAENNSEYFPSTLVVFVINNSVSHPDEVKKDNENSLRVLRAIINNESSFHGIVKKVNDSGLRIGLIDASSKGKELPEKDCGVGFARKAGMDSVLKIFDYDSPSKKVILSLDADCTVETNYLDEVIRNFNEKKLSAAVINFSHQLENNVEAIICYEIFLRYYVLGLKFAGSVYAFHTVGSAMACDYETYIKAEGMNKRKAGEDFYFLEKAAKITDIINIKSTTVYPSSRESWRVPFGTGPRLSRFQSKERNEYLLYNPRCFYILKDWLHLFHSPGMDNAKGILEKAGKIHKELLNFLCSQNFEEDFKRISANTKDEIQLLKQKVKWFDGFRTLKLIHHLRDTAFSLVNMFDALDEMFIKLDITKPEREGTEIPSIEIQKIYLKLIREFYFKYAIS
jgi:hypothetical protein